MNASERAFVHLVTVGCITVITAAISATAVGYGLLALLGKALADDPA